MAVAIDIGGADLHPKNKKEIGRRLGLIALDKVYGKRMVSSGPVYEKMKIDQDKMILSFKNSSSGLMVKGDSLKGFKMAGEDKVFLDAEASIQMNKVVLRNPKIAHPVAVRYGWEANPNSTLYNREGLPAMPFRTDTWND
jgi:sialate O-acetylesterase